MLVNCLFAAVSITENSDIDKKKYSGYGIGFDRNGVYLLSDGSLGRNVVIFGVDMSSSVHVDNKGKDILILGKGPTQGLGEHSFIHKKCIQLILLIIEEKCCLSLHYNGANSYLFGDSTEIIKVKAKESKIMLRKHFKRLVSR